MFSLVWRIFGLNGPENPRQVANQSKQTSQNDATTTSSQKVDFFIEHFYNISF
jgi:hypothetical protein